jgi:membrane fusion protein (multidrug efflux system)
VTRSAPVLAGTTVVACVLALAGCQASGQRTGPAEQAPVPVMVMEVQPRRVPIFAEFAAQTYARNMVEVRSRVEGHIEQWLFRPGADVQAGQVLYVLDLRPFHAAVEQARGNLRQAEADLEFARRQVSLRQAEANLASAQANLLRARQDYDRLRPLVEADAASKQDLDAAIAAFHAGEANVRALEANVDQTRLSTSTQIEAMQGKVEALKGALRTAELNLEYATIHAPVSGRIGDTLIPVGGLVSPNSPQPLSVIVPLDPIWVRFKVTESEYLGWARQGQAVPGHGFPVALVLADKTEFLHRGRIENALNQVDPKTGTLELQARFPNPERTVLPGQFGRVRVRIDERPSAILVPQKAVQQLQSMSTVYVVGADNTVAMRPITTGSRVGDSWIVEEGLQPGERVIVEGLLKVRPGARVQPQPYRPENAEAESR